MFCISDSLQREAAQSDVSGQLTGFNTRLILQIDRMTPAVPYDQLRSALVLWLPYLAIAAICLAAGLGPLALSLLRSRDRLLLWARVFSTLYSLRLFWGH